MGGWVDCRIVCVSASSAIGCINMLSTIYLPPRLEPGEFYLAPWHRLTNVDEISRGRLIVHIILLHKLRCWNVLE